ncbi:MAG: crossover junction endodeoxyribonuclease RuvC [Ignavibacteriales bacterium]|nr:crossover junction endodeoxyribonuclease RuvC [Ignavibacteriales bacterium]
MIILGVDPGSLTTGYGVVDFRGSSYRLLACDVVRNSADAAMPIRLKSIYERLVAVIRKFKPDAMAIESAFYGKNVQSTLKIGYVRGVSLLAAVQCGIPTVEYSPREVKRAIAGNGAASKERVQFMVKSILGLNELPKPLDISDALAVALCHSHYVAPFAKKSRAHAHLKRAAGQSWSQFILNHPERIARSR